MAIDGIGGKQPINNKHTMESLNIKKGTFKASIFIEIDKSDGTEDGYLTDAQYFDYQRRAPKDGCYATGSENGVEYRDGVLIKKIYGSYGNAKKESLFIKNLGSSPNSETTYTFYDEKAGDKAGLLKSQHNLIIDAKTGERIEQELDPLTGNILSETYRGQTINYKYDSNGHFLSASSLTSMLVLEGKSGKPKEIGQKETILNTDGTKTVRILCQEKEVATYKYNGNELIDQTYHYTAHPFAILNYAYNKCFNRPGYNDNHKPSF